MGTCQLILLPCAAWHTRLCGDLCCCRIFGTPFDPKAAWTVDACLVLPPGPASDAAGSRANPASPAAAGAEPGSSGTLFLDIVKMQQQWSGDPADLERFTAWGYRQGLGGWAGRLMGGQTPGQADRRTGRLLACAVLCCGVLCCAVWLGCQHPWLPAAGTSCSCCLWTAAGA